MPDGPAVLLGWELGAGLGHVRRLLLLADALAGRGFRPVLALRDLIGPRPMLQDCRFPILQAPVYTAAGPMTASGFVARSYADILSVHGFADADHLWAMTQAWRALLDLVRPAFVVADHSPTLCLAASGAAPTIYMDNGFCLPPSDLPNFPVLSPDRRALMDEASLLETVQEVRRRLGQPALPALPALFASARRFVTVFPELDPYHELRREPAAGPLEPTSSPLPPPERPSFFAYFLADAPGWEATLAALAGTGFPGRAYVHGAGEAARERLRRLGLGVLDRPIPMNHLLEPSAVIVSHGNLGTAQAALAAGRPQFLFPAHLEHFSNARRLHALGVAHYLTGQFPVADVGEGLRQLLTDPAFTRRAQEAAHAIQARGPYDVLAAVLAHCDQWLPGRPSARASSSVPVPSTKESVS